MNVGEELVGVVLLLYQDFTTLEKFITTGILK